MNKKSLLLAGLTLALIGAAAGLLRQAKSYQRLGPPGVKTQKIAGSENLAVLLPETAPGWKSEFIPQAEIVTNTLPKDTSFGQRLYTADDGFKTSVNVVLMGTDRTSIHKPQICLVGQGWKFDNNATRIENVPMTRPMAYNLPVMRIVASMQGRNAEGQTVSASAVYVYWFVDGKHVTAKHWERMWWMARDILLTGELDRWAYVTFFAVCAPGQEAATFERMKKLMADTVPEFQLVPRPAK